MNLCLHKQDFGLHAEWIFFATSHSKSPCDRIGGSVKRHAAKSLQRPMNIQILDYQAMLNVCKEKISKIKFFGKQCMKCVNHLRNSFQVETLFQLHEAATTSYHYHHPKLHTSYQVKMCLVLVLLILIFPQLSNCVISDQYVTCLYDSFWWVDLVTQVNVEQSNVKVQFMFPHKPCKTFNWPETEDSCYVPIKNILCQISSPITITGWTYKITDEEYDKTISACQYLNTVKWFFIFRFWITVENLKVL